MTQHHEEFGGSSHVIPEQRPHKLERAAAVLEHFGSRNINPGTMDIDWFLTVLGSMWHRESRSEERANMTEVLVRPLPRSLEPIEDDSYLDRFVESGGNLRVTRKGVEVRARVIGIPELAAAFEIEKASSLELADSALEVRSSTGVEKGSSEDVLERLSKLTLDDEAKNFMDKLTPSVLRVIAHLHYPQREAAKKLGLSPHTVKDYTYIAKSVGGFKKVSDLVDFLTRKGLLLDEA